MLTARVPSFRLSSVLHPNHSFTHELTLGYAFAYVSVFPECQHHEPPCRHRHLPHDFADIHLDKYSLGLISDLPIPFLSTTLSAFLSSDRPDTHLRFG